MSRSDRFRRGRTLLVAGVVGALLVLGVNRLPQGTQASSLIVRGLVGLGIGLCIIVVVRRAMVAFGGAPPSAPDTVDARAADVVYECPVCGTRVRLEVAATAKAPKHCGEEMEARIAT